MSAADEYFLEVMATRDPDKLRRMIERARADGLLETLKLHSPRTLEVRPRTPRGALTFPGLEGDKFTLSAITSDNGAVKVVFTPLTPRHIPVYKAMVMSMAAAVSSLEGFTSQAAVLMRYADEDLLEDARAEREQAEQARIAEEAAALRFVQSEDWGAF